MKRQHLIPIVATSGIAAAFWTALAGPESPAPISGFSTPVSSAPGTAAQARTFGESEMASSAAALQEAKKEIESRIGISCCQEITEPGDTGIDEAYDAGTIVDATLEEVVAALDAAAATPEFDDDIAALRLAHRGSYRFFEQPPSTAPDPIEKK